MRWKGIVLAGAGTAGAATAFWLWLTMLSPFTYEFPDYTPPLEQQAEWPVFVYGTLRFAPVRWLAMGADGEPEPYTLCGYVREGLDLQPAAQHSCVDGLLLNVSADQLRRLDRYERLGVRYDRVPLDLPDQDMAWVYTRLSD